MSTSDVETMVGQRWKDETKRSLALSEAERVLSGAVDVESVAADFLAAFRAYHEAQARMTGAVIAAHLQGESELSISKRTGITRVTIRRALGK